MAIRALRLAKPMEPLTGPLATWARGATAVRELRHDAARLERLESDLVFFFLVRRVGVEASPGTVVLSSEIVDEVSSLDEPSSDDSDVVSAATSSDNVVVVFSSTIGFVAVKAAVDGAPATATASDGEGGALACFCSCCCKKCNCCCCCRYRAVGVNEAVGMG